MARALSYSSLVVLRALLDGGGSPQYGLALIKTTGVRAGALYPILSRFEREGWIEGSWEAIDESAEGRRKRRYYLLTGVGERAAREELANARKQLSPSLQLQPGAGSASW
jgi:PadR family transcriptional regulator PadR